VLKIQFLFFFLLKRGIFAPFFAGFNYNFPFLSSDCGITTSGYGVEPLYKHFINIEHPTMCFLVLANHVSPMQLADLEV